LARRTSLTGAWSGAYRYPRGRVTEVVFNAQIAEADNVFTGAIQEPSLRARHHQPVATSDIEGSRVGRDVVFTKTYDGSAGMAHAVHYDGIANDALTRIEGRWKLDGGLSGTFFMARDDDGETAAAEERAEAAAPR
jgi:hypothetical protein